MLEILKAILFGIVEGITEWLPVSSTGHLILLDEFIRLQASEEFLDMFNVVIQLGAILAVILLFFRKLNPLDKRKSEKQRFKTWRLWFMVIAAIILIGICFVMFTGKITYVYGTDSFTVDATYHHALTVKYDTIDEIEYREGNVSGIRSYGFASLRLLLGFFENEEFGTYTRYTYYKPESCIVVTSGSKTLVISGENAAETQEIYHALLTRIG